MPRRWSAASGGRCESGSEPTTSAASASPRASTAAALSSPGFERGDPLAKLTADGYPVCQASTSSAPAALPSWRSVTVTACVTWQRSRTSAFSPNASTCPATWCRIAAEREPRSRAARSSSGASDAAGSSRTSARRVHSASTSRSAGSSMKVSACSAVAVRRSSTTINSRFASGSRSRSSSRGCVVAGSARHSTTTSARSRTSPSVAVLAPRAWKASPDAPSSSGPAESITAPIFSANATATRCASQVVWPSPYTSGTRAPLRIAAASSSARSSSASSPSMRASGGTSPARSRNHASPSGHVRSSRSSPPSSPTTATMSSHTRPQPAQVADRSGTDTHFVELGTQRVGACLQLGEHGLRGAPVATSVQIGRPAAMASPGWGTSRIPRAVQSLVSGTRRPSVANSTALPAAPDGRAAAAGRRPAQLDDDLLVAPFHAHRGAVDAAVRVDRRRDRLDDHPRKDCSRTSSRTPPAWKDRPLSTLTSRTSAGLNSSGSIA